MAVPAIITEIATELAALNRYPKRLRMAVSRTEHDEIKAHMLATYGEFYNRILNVPLVIAPEPDNPILFVEIA